MIFQEDLLKMPAIKKIFVFDVNQVLLVCKSDLNKINEVIREKSTYNEKIFMLNKIETCEIIKDILANGDKIFLLGSPFSILEKEHIDILAFFLHEHKIEKRDFSYLKSIDKLKMLNFIKDKDKGKRKPNNIIYISSSEKHLKLARQSGFETIIADTRSDKTSMGKKYLKLLKDLVNARKETAIVEPISPKETAIVEPISPKETAIVEKSKFKGIESIQNEEIFKNEIIDEKSSKISHTVKTTRILEYENVVSSNLMNLDKTAFKEPREINQQTLMNLCQWASPKVKNRFISFGIAGKRVHLDALDGSRRSIIVPGHLAQTINQAKTQIKSKSPEKFREYLIALLKEHAQSKVKCTTSRHREISRLYRSPSEIFMKLQQNTEPESTASLKL
jgi:hypothetical protein